MFERFEPEYTEPDSREVLIDHDELREAIIARDTIIAETASGIVHLKGLGAAIRQGGERLYVEAEFQTYGDRGSKYRRGQLITGSITTGSRITVKNSGGKSRSDVVKAARVRSAQNSY